jgi:hypothetical protein
MPASNTTGVFTATDVYDRAINDMWVTSGFFGDPNYKYTTLLLSGNGTNNANNSVFLDSSTNNFPITKNGNSTQGTITPYGSNWSNYFNGSSTISIAAGPAFNLSTVDFSIEMWVYPISQSQYGGLLTFDAGDYPLHIAWPSAVTTNIGLGIGTASAWIISPTDPFGTTVFNQWTHLLITRTGNEWRTFQDGVLRSYTVQAGSVGDSSGSIYVGANGTTGYTSVANISNLRIVKNEIPRAYQTLSTTLGTRVFTPSEYPLTITSQGVTAASVSLLTCQSNRFIDNSLNNFAVTRNGSPSIQKFSPTFHTPYTPLNNGGSAYFDGTGDYLSIPNSTNLNLGSTDFTIEGWWYPIASSNQNLIAKWWTGGTQWVVQWRSAGYFRFAVNSSTFFDFSVTLTLNSWYHFAVVRSGVNLNFYFIMMDVVFVVAVGCCCFNYCKYCYCCFSLLYCLFYCNLLLLLLLLLF